METDLNPTVESQSASSRLGFISGCLDGRFFASLTAIAVSVEHNHFHPTVNRLQRSCRTIGAPPIHKASSRTFPWQAHSAKST